MIKKINRRQFIVGSGGVLFSLPFFESLFPKSAHAELGKVEEEGRRGTEAPARASEGRSPAVGNTRFAQSTQLRKTREPNSQIKTHSSWRQIWHTRFKQSRA